MPWFCSSTRKKSKTKVGGVRGGAVIGSSSKPLLGVLLQNFTATAQDELTVLRGQVIELFYCDGNWRYVRDVDGKCGYVPNAFCYPLDRMLNRGVGQWRGSENGNDVLRYPKFQSRPRTLHLDGLVSQGDATESSEEMPLTSNSNNNRVPAEGVHQATPPRNSTPPEVATCTSAQEAEIVHWRENVAASSSRHSSHSGESSPRYASTPRPTEDRIADAGSLSGTDGADGRASACSQDEDEASLPPPRTSTPEGRDVTPDLPTPYSVTPQPPSCVSDCETESNCPSSRCCRTQTAGTMETSSQDDLLDAEEAVDELSELQTDLHRQATMPTPIPITVFAASPQYDRLDCLPPSSMQVVANVPEDVFPDVKKPQGIYRCVEAFEAQFEGQVSLRKNELVIVLEFGQGDWAWVFTSASSEGLVPKSILERHQPRLWMVAGCNVDQLSVGTQTELIVSEPATQLRVLSASSATRTSDAPCSQASPRSEAAHSEMATVGVQTEFVSREWFKNNASPRHDENDQQARAQTPPRLRLSLCSKRLNSTLPNSPTSVASSPMPVSRSRPRFVSLNALGDHGQHCQRCRRLARSESEPGCDVHSPLVTTPLVRKLQPQTPILTAVRDYQPPVNGKNCLSLRKGDVLYQQSHVPYPNGWMWVYHSGQRSFGYVPKSHVAYMYLLQRKPQTQGRPLEVEV